MSTMSASYTTTAKPRAPHTHKSKLPPVVAHGLDIVRAARMGIDISYMRPDERCKYPSKFCCNVRAHKSTGKLHRFCEDHRSRASVNQKRWSQVRRRHHETASQVLTSAAHATLDTGFEWLAMSDMEPSPNSSTTTDLSDDEVHMLMTILLCDAPQDREVWKGGDACSMANLLATKTPSGTAWFAGGDLGLVDRL